VFPHNEHKLLTLRLDEFLRHFLLHLLPKRPRAQPQLRLAGQPAPCHYLATLLSVAGFRTRTTSRARGFHRPSERYLALPQPWWSMVVVERSPPTRFNCALPPSADRCRMKRLSPTESFACFGAFRIDAPCRRTHRCFPLLQRLPLPYFLAVASFAALIPQLFIV
jgi:hypothetical protein